MCAGGVHVRVYVCGVGVSLTDAVCVSAVVQQFARCEVVVKCGRSNMVVARVLWGSCRLLQVLRRSVYCKSQLDVFVDVLVGVSATSLCATR
jgi:hypothetical protein